MQDPAAKSALAWALNTLKQTPASMVEVRLARGLRAKSSALGSRSGPGSHVHAKAR